VPTVSPPEILTVTVTDPPGSGIANKGVGLLAVAPYV